MRTALLLATLFLAAAAQAQQPAPAQPPPAASTDAPSLPTGMTPEEAAEKVPDSGTITKVNVQGNRRVEADAIRAQIPIKAGDSFDKEKIKATLLAAWRMGYFSDVKLDVSAAKPPLTGYV